MIKEKDDTKLAVCVSRSGDITKNKHYIETWRFKARSEICVIVITPIFTTKTTYT